MTPEDTRSVSLPRRCSGEEPQPQTPALGPGVPEREVSSSGETRTRPSSSPKALDVSRVIPKVKVDGQVLQFRSPQCLRGPSLHHQTLARPTSPLLLAGAACQHLWLGKKDRHRTSPPGPPGSEAEAPRLQRGRRRCRAAWARPPAVPTATSAASSFTWALHTPFQSAVDGDPRATAGK